MFLNEEEYEQDCEVMRAHSFDVPVAYHPFSQERAYNAIVPDHTVAVGTADDLHFENITDWVGYPHTGRQISLRRLRVLVKIRYPGLDNGILDSMDVWDVVTSHLLVIRHKGPKNPNLSTQFYHSTDHPMLVLKEAYRNEVSVLASHFRIQRPTVVNTAVAYPVSSDPPVSSKDFFSKTCPDYALVAFDLTLDETLTGSPPNVNSDPAYFLCMRTTCPSSDRSVVYSGFSIMDYTNY